MTNTQNDRPLVQQWPVGIPVDPEPLSDDQRRAYLAALEAERSAYLARGKADRAEQVTAEIARLRVGGLVERAVSAVRRTAERAVGAGQRGDQ